MAFAVLAAAALCLLLPPPAGAFTSSADGEPLATPAEVGTRTSPHAVTVDLEIGEFLWEGPHATVWTRAFNGMIPGPTMRVRPGDTLTINLKNALGQQPLANTAHNEFKSPNTTNLHTHGLHIGSTAPSDDVFVRVEPGETYTYTHQIPSDHMPGTFWYHPHSHGSAALQTGGGAAGAIIVEDPDLELPAEVSSMPQYVMVLQHISIDSLASIGRSAGDDLWKPLVTNTTSTSPDALLLNGQYRPTLAVEAGQWTMWRAVLSSAAEAVALTAEGCEMGLLAKDGIFLHTAPRPVSTIFLPPGGRADVAVRCSSPGEVFVRGRPVEGMSMNSDHHSGHHSGMGMGGGMGMGMGAGMGMMGATFFEGVVFYLDVKPAAAAAAAAAALPTFSVKRPCYLVDLRGVPSGDLAGTYSLRFGPVPLINGVKFSSPEGSITDMTIGGVHEWEVHGVEAHPFHIHVNSFQIVSVEDQSDSFFQVGDWHDVALFPNAMDMTIRFQTDRYGGKVVIHCHILEHEDQGMMAVATITGAEGGMWPGARGVDPTCRLPAGATLPVPAPPPPADTSAAARLAASALAIAGGLALALVQSAIIV